MFAESKYRAKRTRAWDGTLCDSAFEAERHNILVMRQRAGNIRDLRWQVKYELIPKQEGERPVTYVADFVYKDKDGNEVVEDVKGVRTDAYIIKRKLMLWRYGIRIREVTRESYQG